MFLYAVHMYMENKMCISTVNGYGKTCVYKRWRVNKSYSIYFHWKYEYENGLKVCKLVRSKTFSKFVIKYTTIVYMSM